MVFESIVVDVLNRFLGDYVENLNGSQLKLGIWGGDVRLDNLILKQNAFKELDIPVQISHGILGKLVLKIPWKNLYGSSVEASIERLLLIVNPVSEIKYDAEKEEKMALSSKKAELKRIEEAKKREAETGESELDETFVEKLVTQIIKNVQLNIKDIHIRYEDSITNPKSPFSFGFTLHNLSVHTTDENWTQAIIQESVTKIFKILTLEGLAMYWNPASDLYSRMESDVIGMKLQSEIATKNSLPDKYLYVLGPINATAKLKINPKPENDEPRFSIPKVILSLHMEQLLVNMTKLQYQDMMRLADSMDMMAKGAPYRKYRPDLRTYRGHYKEWWRFAYTCVLEEDVRRRRRNWEWNHMLCHRRLCKDYATAYHSSLSNKGKVSSAHKLVLDEGEKKLDVFNLVVIRQRIEMEVERLGKMQEAAKKARGWFGWWYGESSKAEGELAEETALLTQFQNAMTPEEKEKLFRAIDYQENDAPLHLPTEYVSTQMTFRLDKLQLTVLNDEEQVLKGGVHGVEVQVKQRPSANSIRLDISMEDFKVLGLKQQDYVPKLVTSKEDSRHSHLLNIMFETNPIDGTCDQRVRVNAQSLQMIYDAQTVIQIVDIFKPPSDSTAISTLQAVAENKISNLKEKSALGMQYAVQSHTFIDTYIDFAASYIIVPQNGKYLGDEACVVVQLGAINVKTEPRSQKALDVHKMFQDGLAGEDIFKEIFEHSYDKMVLTLTEMQVVIAHPSEDWRAAIAIKEATPLHLLQPTNWIIQIQKCLISNDPRLPKVKMIGELEKIAIIISEDRLLKLCEILVGMPLPESESGAPLKPSDSKSSSLSLLKYLDPAEKQKRDMQSTHKMLSKETDEQTIQLTDLQALFVMKEAQLIVKRESGGHTTNIVFSLNLLEIKATQKTFNFEADVRLGSIELEYHRPKFRPVVLITTPAVNTDREQYLFRVTYINVNKKCPEFRSKFGSVEQLIVLDFTTLEVLLHLESLKEIMVTANVFQTRLNDITSKVDRIADSGPLETIVEGEELSAVKSKSSATRTPKPKQVESIQLKVKANINAVQVGFATDKKSLSNVQIEGMTAGFILKSSYTQVDFKVASITVLDLNPVTIHQEILKVIGGNVMNVQVIMYNIDKCKSITDVNMSVTAEINCLRIVFLNWYVTSMLEFMNNFQSAQQAILEAADQAADAARANVQNAYENTTKISMKVRLAAPIIIIPENSRSNTTIVVDLGNMTLMNRFMELTVPDVKTKVIVEELILDLENVKVSCLRLNDRSGLNMERNLLKPTSFKLLMKRSLSTWYQNIPDLEVSGRIKTISFTIGFVDYKTILNIINNNLQEGKKSVPEPKQPVPVVSVKSSKSMKIQSGKVTSQYSKLANVVDLEKQKTPKTTIKFAFAMDSFVIDLMNTVQSQDETFEKDVDLARFCLALLSVKGRLFSDGSMHTSVLLIDCTLDDMRPGRGTKITRYLERRRDKVVETDDEHKKSSPDLEKIRSMIDITYTMKNNDTFADVRIFSFNLILAMDFMNKLIEFVTAANPTPVTKIGEEENDTKLPAKSALSQVKPEMSKRKLSFKSESQAFKEEKAAMMTVNIKIERPDIILVASMEDRECDALVLNMEMRLKLRQTSERMVADGGICGLQMIVRKLNSSSGPESCVSKYLLSPATLSVAASQPPGSGLHLDVALSDIKIVFSPDILRLLNLVLTTMTSSEDGTEEQDHKPIFFDRLWDIRPFKPHRYWYLQTELAEDALSAEDISEPVAEQKPPTGEICFLSSPSIIISFEMEIGSETIPVLVIQGSLLGQVKDWSSEFYLDSTWAMQVSYYNIGRAVWEPLIEPVEVMKDCTYKHVPWELKIEMIMRAQEQQSLDASDEASAAAALSLRQANRTLTVSSSEPLEVTLTRTGIEVLTQLSANFSAAIAETSTTDLTLSTRNKLERSVKYYGAPYVLHNNTGLTIKLRLADNPDFSVFLVNSSDVSQYQEVVLERNASVPLQLKRGGLNLMKLNEPPPPLRLYLQMVELEEDMVIPVERADKRYFPLQKKQGTMEPNVPLVAAVEPRGIISQIVMQDGAMHIYIRSIIQVSNSLSVGVSVYYLPGRGGEARLLGEAAPRAVLRLPLVAVHTPTAELFFSVEGFSISTSPVVWRELQQEVKMEKLLTCETKDKYSNEKFYIKAVGSMEQVFLENTSRYTFASCCYEIDLKPAVKMQNCLPVEIEVSQLGLLRTQTFQPGDMFHLAHLAPNYASIVITIKNYLDKCWVCTKNLPEADTELSVWTFESHDSPSVMTLELGMHNVDADGTQLLSLYCPFWMLNKTGLTLSYRSSDDQGNVIFHPADYKDPILFSFRAKNFFGKKKACIRVGFGAWSDKFSLDVPGSSGVITCENEGQLYQVAVTNQLTFNSLTKIVMFTPYFLIINEAPFPLEYQELHRPADPWKEVEKESCSALWPVVEKEDKLLVLRVACMPEKTAPFLYTEQNTTCLRLNNVYGGLHVEVQISEGGTYITVRQYHDGLAPALVVNYTTHTISMYEKENVNVKKLKPMHEILFTWDNPAGPRVLIFEGHKPREVENQLRQDGFGTFMIDEEHAISWVSFLDGLQRVVLLTEDKLLASGVHTIGEAELVDTEVVLSIHGLGFSLVDDVRSNEILYMSISNSGIIWEQTRVGARRYKKMDPHKAVLFEEAYQRYLSEKAVSEEPVPPIVQLDDKTEVNLEEMRVIKPSGRLLRRTQEPGLWLSYGLTPHSRRLHARLHRLQVDQQLPLPTFPVVFAPVPPPRSVATQTHGMRPFMEISIVERIMEQSRVRQYKYYKVLVQEFHVKIDMGLVTALMNMFPQRELTHEEALDAFTKDLEKARQPMEALAAASVVTDQKNFYDDLHLSPLKVHMSFSLGGATQLPTFVGTILQSIGVTLTDMNDVVFKLSYYEKQYEFLSQKELISQVQSHYTGQALKQLYVLVLGLDVIGNPYGLVIGLKKGVEDLFYEPFQGAIQGPGEFAEGLFLGVRSLVGHTVGGAAGAVSRITGAMGHGLAALSLDKDYQRRRRDNINKPPANLQEGLARSGKGLVMGFVDGVTGVITKPIEGAQDDGVGGFFKGLGRGAMGLVARPTAGFVDFASGSFDAVKRAAELSEEVTKRRPPRILPADTGVVPYSLHSAEGNKILREVEKGKFVNTDMYEGHVWSVPNKEVAILTDKRLLYLEKNTVFGGWQIVWSYLWSDIPKCPSAVNKGVYIPASKKKVLGMFSSAPTGKVIFIHEEQHKKYFLKLCQRLMDRG